MIGNNELLDEVGRTMAQDASIPALRMGLFVFATLAAMAWSRRKPHLALFWLGLCGFVSLDYWLVQMVAPLGLGTDAALTRQWAQAGVNAAAEPAGMGFVSGTAPEPSLPAKLALMGVSLPVVQVVPQIAALLCLGVQLLLPICLFRNRTTGVFAASLAVSGGLWPGMSPYGGVMRDPSAFATTMLVLGLLLFAASALGRDVRRRFHRSAVGAALVLVGLAALGRALGRGVEPGITVALLQITASILLASPLRRLLRRISSPFVPARWAEAVVLLATITGSGLLWWNPVMSVPGFEEARDDNAALRRPMKWISDNVPAGSVVLSSNAYSASITALAGRRVLFPPPAEVGEAGALPEPFRRSRLYESTLQGRPIARLAEAFSATHFFLGPGEMTPPLQAPEEQGDEARLTLVPVYEDAKDFRVFLLAKK